MKTLKELEIIIDYMLPELEDGEQPIYCILKNPIVAGESNSWPPILTEELFKRAGDTRAKKERSFYMSTMLALAVDGEWRNKQACFSALWAVVLDDIGQKVDPNLLQPSLKIETSKGSFQWVYLLDEPITDIDTARQLIAAVYETDLTDKGGGLVNKYFRLPFGINNKMRMNGDGTAHLDEFEVNMVEANEGVFYSVQELLDAWGLELQPLRKKRRSGKYKPITGRAIIVPDVVLDWISDTGRLLGGTDSSGFRKMICPWNPEHVAGYSPLGEGGDEFYKMRGFHCFHDTCKGHDSAAFIEIVNTMGGPDVEMFDNVADLVGRFALIESEKTVYDLSATAVTTVRSMSTSAFSDANQQIVAYGSKGGGITGYRKWVEHDQMKKLRGHHYNPSGAVVLTNNDGISFLNSYLPPNHAFEQGEPVIFLNHVKSILPNAEDAELFLDWLAYKLQHPELRAYAVLMVAGTYGIGRSTLGKVINRLVQGATATIDFSDLIGEGSQGQFNEWLDSNQFIIVNEVKQSTTNYIQDHSAYEAIKEVIDDSPSYGMRCKRKYGGIGPVDFYGDFLLFSNHEDAMQLPEGDRRFMVMENSKVKRTIEENASMHSLVADDAKVAQVYWWLMERDVDGFNAHEPPMSDAKRRMIQQGKSVADQIMEQVVEDMAGAVATEAQIKREAGRIAMSDYSLNLLENAKVASAIEIKVRALAPINPKLKGRSRLAYTENGKTVKVPARILRDVAEWQELAVGKMMASLVVEARLNGSIT